MVLVKWFISRLFCVTFQVRQFLVSKVRGTDNVQWQTYEHIFKIKWGLLYFFFLMYLPFSCLTLTFRVSDMRYLQGLLSNPLLLIMIQFRNKNRPFISVRKFSVQFFFHMVGKSSISTGNDSTLPALWYLIIRCPGTARLMLI